MDIERSNKIIQMISELCNYIDSIDNKLDRTVNMEASIMTMIDMHAMSNNTDSITITKHILKNFEKRGV